MEEREDGINGKLQYLFLLLVPIIEIILYGIGNHATMSEQIHFGLWTVLFDGIFVLSLLLRSGQADRWRQEWLLVFLQLVSVPLALMYVGDAKIPLFLLGAVLAGALMGLDTGMFMTVYLSLFVVLCGGSTSEMMVLISLGLVLCMLTKWMYSKKNLAWILITGVSAAMMLCVLGGIGDFDAGLPDLVQYLIASAAMLVFVFFAKQKYPTEETKTDAGLDTVDPGKSTREESAVEMEVCAAEENESPSLAKGPAGAGASGQISQKEYEKCRTHDLLHRLQQELPKVYSHSRKIARYSKAAAELIGADAGLCELGGWYHEIGKLEDKKDPITARERLMKSEQMPQELIDLCRQASGKEEVPESREAAVVMLTESIVTTLRFLKAKQEKVAPAKVVENVFQLRLSKGTLDQSGLTVRDFGKLKRFYLMEFVFENEEGKSEQGNA